MQMSKIRSPFHFPVFILNYPDWGQGDLHAICQMSFNLDIRFSTTWPAYTEREIVHDRIIAQYMRHDILAVFNPLSMPSLHRLHHPFVAFQFLNLAVYFTLNALHAIYGVYITSKTKLQFFFGETKVDASAATTIARRAKFEGVFPKIRDELIEYFAGQGVPQDAVEWYRNVHPVH